MKPKYALFLFGLLTILVPVNAQTAPGKYWVRFTDKDNSPYSLADPSAFLSPATVLRRAVLGIPYEERDLPVNEAYIQQVLATGDCTLHNRSKWFNAITIATADSTLLEVIAALPFVAETRAVVSWTQPEKGKYGNVPAMPRSAACSAFEKAYGPSFRQVEMLNGHRLHQLGFRGSGISIAVLDAGFWRTDLLPAFASLRARGGIAGVRDFVAGGTGVYNHSNHGTFVLSVMAGQIPDSLCGAAPDATYWLFRTEDSASEYRVEEDNWVAAAELCDSLGIDIINSSLGYSLFDDSLQHYSFADMDGNTTRVTQAADLAARRGILVVNSAGNSGNSAWRYITAPSDGDSVLCVGAVDANRVKMGFSGFGPSSDGDTKPNVCAMGGSCVLADLDSTIHTGSRTSFSSPLVAAMSACLGQVVRDRANMEIFGAVQRSAEFFNNPNDSVGYGIPAFWQAFLLLRGSQQSGQEDALEIWPNPSAGPVNLLVNAVDACVLTASVYDASGKLVWESKAFQEFGGAALLHADPPLSPGCYLVRVREGDSEIGVQRLVRMAP